MTKTTLCLLALFAATAGLLLSGCVGPGPGGPYYGHASYSVYGGYHGGPPPRGGHPGARSPHRRPGSPGHIGRPGGGGRPHGGGGGRPHGGGGGRGRR